MVADDAEPKESGIGQEELDSIEKQFSELRALIDENIKFLTIVEEIIKNYP